MKLVPRTRDEVRATLLAMDAQTRAMISADWWAKFEASAFQDPWVHGFRLVLPDGTNVGVGSFKGPPVDGMVEIAYAVVPEHQRKGYATQASRLMVAHAFESPEVRVVRAHTLRDGVASQGVLRKCGFQYVGDVLEPEDGLVSRFEVVRPTA
jgi:[ribosomal protein S5]-alanine N-acetyltransferase